jgi:hypothetical protein
MSPVTSKPASPGHFKTSHPDGRFLLGFGRPMTSLDPNPASLYLGSARHILAARLCRARRGTRASALAFGAAPSGKRAGTAGCCGRAGRAGRTAAGAAGVSASGPS